MDLLVLLVADYANVAEGQKLNVMGIFGNIRARKFPARHSDMYLIVKLSAGPAEYNLTRKLTIKLLDEDAKEELVNWSRDILVPQGTGRRRVEINQIVRLRDITFPRSGVYEFSVLVDQDTKGTLPLHVIEVHDGEEQEGS